MRRIAPFREARALAHALAFVSLVVMSSLAMGCAADEAEEREAAYPGQVGPVAPVGTTPPNELGDRAQPPPPPSAPPEEVAGGEPPPAAAPPGAPPPGAAPSDVGVDFAAGAPPSEAIGAGGDDGAGAPPAYGPPSGDGSGQYADTDPSALNDFRSTLDPYGTWVQDPNYGTVWVPSPSAVGDDFTPYLSNGYWSYDDGYADNYVWNSDYSWGWAPFHYGRWAYASRGWCWIPGRQYAGAWVSWRYGEGPWGYVGWAPLAPTWGWRGGAAVSLGFTPRVGYSFVANRDLFGPGMRSHLIVGPQATLIGEHTQPWVASPRVGASVGFGAHFGPPPSVLNIAPAAVVRTSANPGVMQARSFARPSNVGGARAFGATAPQARPGGSWTYRGTTTSLSGDAVRAPAASYGATSQVGAGAHFGGRLGGGFAGSAAGARPYPTARPSGGIYSGGTRTLGGGYSGGARPMGGGAAPRPMLAPMPSSSGGFHGGGSFGGAVHSGGGSFGGGFHGGGGGGGFHGGGGGGGGHGGHR